MKAIIILFHPVNLAIAFNKLLIQQHPENGPVLLFIEPEYCFIHHQDVQGFAWFE
ncbi:hypothetical protein ES705_47694 [subsurface metagenome]